MPSIISIKSLQEISEVSDLGGKKRLPQAACNKEQRRLALSVVTSGGCVFYLKTQTLLHLGDSGLCVWLKYHKVHGSFCAYRIEHSRDNNEVKNLKKTC